MRPALLLLLAIISSACAADTNTRGVVVRDSAGVRIVESTSASWSEDDGWRVSAEPLVRIGAAEGEEASQLYQVRSAGRLTNGNIVVLNSGTQQLRLYDPTGRHIRSIGRSGSGPGEFGFPLNLFIDRGDTLIVNDLERITAFDTAGAFVRVLSLGRWSVQGRFADGSFLQLLIPPGKDPFAPGYFHPDYAIVRKAADGSRADTVGYVPGDEMFRSEFMNGISNFMAPFGRVRTAAIHGDSLYTGDGSTFEIHDLDESGKIARIFRRHAQPAPVTPAAIDALRAVLLKGQLTDAQRTHRESLFEKWSYPEYQPTYDHLLVDREANIWARHYSVDQAATQWSVFNADGRWIGVVDLPSRLDVKQIGSDYVLGVSTDELGVEYVLLYGLHK